MRLLLLTDSLSLPRRSKDDIVEWADVYPNLLKEKFPEIEFIHLGIGGATITELLRQQKYYSLIHVDIVILHCGIVDCSPRALGKIEQSIIKKLHLVRLFKPFIPLLRKVRKHKYTDPKTFENSLLQLKKRYSNSRFISIGIIPATKEYEIILPGITNNIEKYNEILERNSIFINNAGFPTEGIMSDFHHLNSIGHKIIFNKIVELINEYCA